MTRTIALRLEFMHPRIAGGARLRNSLTAPCNSDGRMEVEFSVQFRRQLHFETILRTAANTTSLLILKTKQVSLASNDDLVVNDRRCGIDSFTRFVRCGNDHFIAV